jgi:hypothetical protein
MKRWNVLLLFALLMMLWVKPHMVSAQSQCQNDPDGDCVYGTKDYCPTVAGPSSNNGCPLPKPNNQQPQPLHPPGDSDGDGTLDEKDKCLLDGGPSWNDGCPTDLTAPPQSEPQITLPTMPTSGPCVIATTGQDGVNVRAMPAATAAIIAVLNPANLYPAFASFNGDGETWYLVRAGWSNGGVARIGGACDNLPSFNFNDVLLNFADGPGDGLILNFMPVPGGQPTVTLHPFAGEDVLLNFTKTEDDFPDGGFSFLLTPFPGTGGLADPPGGNSSSPGSNVFDDGFLLSHMGDGSVFIMMPPGSQSDNPLNGILIGLSQPEIDPTGILIGLSQPANLNGILIGLLLPAVQTGESNTTGILIGLLLPAVQVNGDGQSDLVGFSREPFATGGGGGAGAPAQSGGGGGSGRTFPPSIQQVRDMGLNFLVPAVDAPNRQMFMPGWSVEVAGIIMPVD